MYTKHTKYIRRGGWSGIHQNIMKYNIQSKKTHKKRLVREHFDKEMSHIYRHFMSIPSLYALLRTHPLNFKLKRPP